MTFSPSRPSSIIMGKYRVIAKKGEGTFSEVLQCELIDQTNSQSIDQSNNQSKMRAVKCMKTLYPSLKSVNELREIQALKRLSPHPNIVKMHEILYDLHTGRLCIIMELLSMNLYELIKQSIDRSINQRKIKPMNPILIKWLMYQLMVSIDHMHEHGVFHRDIKPENVLVNIPPHLANTLCDQTINQTINQSTTQTNNQTNNPYREIELKVADLGSCRGLYSSPPYTEYISTRWYRAPECLLTNGMYDYKMDLWGVGCVLFELVTCQPLFPGANEVDQLDRIHRILGTPDKRLIDKIQGRSVNQSINPSAHPSKHQSINQTNNQFVQRKGTGYAHLLPEPIKSDCLIDLIDKLITYDPEKRITARQALNHSYFDEFRSNNQTTSQVAKATEASKKPIVNQTTNQSINQSDNQIVNQLVNPSKVIEQKVEITPSEQSHNQTNNQPSEQSINQSLLTARKQNPTIDTTKHQSNNEEKHLSDADYSPDDTPDPTNNQSNNQTIKPRPKTSDDVVHSNNLTITNNQTINQSKVSTASEDYSRDTDYTPESKLSDHSMNHSNAQSANQSINPPVSSFSVDQSLKGLTTPSFYQSDTPPISQSNNQSTNQTQNHFDNHSNHQTINQTINQSINSVVKQSSHSVSSRSSDDIDIEVTTHRTSINPSINRSNNQSNNYLAKHSTYPPASSQPNSQSISESINQAMDSLSIKKSKKPQRKRKKDHQSNSQSNQQSPTMSSHRSISQSIKQSKPVIQTTYQPMNHSINHTLSPKSLNQTFPLLKKAQSTNHPINQTNSQTVSHPAHPTYLHQSHLHHQTANQSNNHSTSQDHHTYHPALLTPIPNQSNNQSVNQSTNQSMTRSPMPKKKKPKSELPSFLVGNKRVNNQSINQSNNQSTSQTVNHSVGHTSLLHHPVSHPVNQSNNQSINPSINQSSILGLAKPSPFLSKLAAAAATPINPIKQSISQSIHQPVKRVVHDRIR